MSSRFKRVRNKAELDALINTVIKNKKTLQNQVTEELVGKEFAKQGEATESPIIAELQNVSKKIDEVLNPVEMEHIVPNAPWLGKKPKIVRDQNTGEMNAQRLLLSNVLKSIVEQPEFFKEIMTAREFREMIRSDKRNKTMVNEIKKLSQQTKQDTKSTVTLLSQLLKTDKESVIELLKLNIGETQNIAAALNLLEASADPIDLGGKPGPSGSPGSSSINTQNEDEDEEFYDAYGKITPTPHKSASVTQFSQQPAPSPFIKKEPKTTDATHTPTLSTTDSKTGDVIKSTGTDKNTPIGSSDNYDEIEELRQKKRAEEQLKANEETDEYLDDIDEEEEQEKARLETEKFLKQLENLGEPLDKNEETEEYHDDLFGLRENEKREKIISKFPLIANFMKQHQITISKVPEIENSDTTKITSASKEERHKLAQLLAGKGTQYYKKNLKTSEANRVIRNWIKSYRDFKLDEAGWERNTNLISDSEEEYGGEPIENVQQSHSEITKTVVFLSKTNTDLKRILDSNRPIKKSDFPKYENLATRIGIELSKKPKGGYDRNYIKQLIGKIIVQNNLLINKLTKHLDAPSSSSLSPSTPTLVRRAKKNATPQSPVSTDLSLPKKQRQLIFSLGSPTDTAKKEQTSSTPSTPTNQDAHGLGKGKTYDPYKVDGSGVFGQLHIDLPMLKRMRLRAHKHGKQIAYQDVPFDLHELLTKKYNARKQYHPEAIELFKKLVKHAEIPVTSTNSAKYKHIIAKMGSEVEQNASGKIWDPLSNLVARNAWNGGNAKRAQEGRAQIDMPDSIKGDFRQTGNGCECDNNDVSVKIYSNPDEVIERLHILLGEENAGNSNHKIKNEISQLIEWLKKHGHVGEEDYKMLMKASGLDC